jgi:amidase/nitrilase
MPTYVERLYHGLGDGSDLEVYETAIGRIGGLICFENHMPLIKAVMMTQGQHIHAAVWPGHWRGGSVGESMNLACTDINKCDVTPATRDYAVDAQCFVVSANLLLTIEDIPDDFPFKNLINYVGEGQDNFVCFCCGGSHIVNPFSEFIAGPVFGEETILYADCDYNLIKAAKVQIDVMGHYQRWDIAKIQLNLQKTEPFSSEIRFTKKELEDRSTTPVESEKEASTDK